MRDSRGRRPYNDQVRGRWQAQEADNPVHWPVHCPAFLPSAFAQNPDDYRGGWKTEVNGVPRTWEFSIRGESVRGIYYTWCADATTLAFVDGKFGPDGLSFTVTHVDNNGKTTFTDTGTAKFEKPNLVVTGTFAGQVFTDARPWPQDPNPSWRGYSSAKWSGDTLVV